MASIIKKKKGSKTYYYAAESARVNGKPRIVWQKYLGTLDSILKKCQDNPPEVIQTDIFDAGGVAAMLQIVNKIGLIDIINEVVPKKNQGPSVGEFLALAIINRIMDPCSKLQMADWYKETSLLRLWKYHPQSFTSQNFWNNMDLIKLEHISQIQEKITHRVLELFDIDPSALLYDTSNFFTYIATGNNRNTLAQRGRSKAKRNDLRQVGLALMVTKDFHIPLFHKVYQGNLPDKGTFVDRAKEIKRWEQNAIGKFNDSTMVFDKGNISEEAFEQLIGSGQHFTCAIPKNTIPEIFKTPISDFKSLSGIPGTKAHSGQCVMYSKEFKFVLAYSESYFAARLKDLTEMIQKREKKLRELDHQLADWSKRKHYKSRPTRKSVEATLKSILSGDYIKDVIQAQAVTREGIQRVEYEVKRKAIENLMNHELGRTLIITTRLNKSDAELIHDYRGLHVIEAAFKKMKHQDFLHWQPAYHWTDSKIEVHGLYCVLALLISSLAHKTVIESKIDVSLPVMLDELSKIREVAFLFKSASKSKKKNQITLSNMTPRQKKIADALGVIEVLQG